VVLGEVGVDRLEERPNEGCFPRRTDNGALAVDVHDCATVSASRRPECMGRPTLIVRDRHDQDCEDQPPQAESIDDGGEDAVAVELLY
jgi:hypothetical protein